MSLAVKNETVKLTIPLTHADPIIFRGLKSITFNDTQQTSLLRLAAEGISVRNYHTAQSTPNPL
jgi:putative NIF3 family GTP cyclohydrolase 1 type 2